MISCIIGLMDRVDRLEEMLPTWTKVDKIKDFVIVDWSSKHLVINSKIVQEQINKKNNIKVIRVDDQKYFYRCLAWNLANQYTDPENKILLKLDVDYVNVDESWLNYLIFADKKLNRYFITGSSAFYDHSTGFLLVNKEDFGDGYNENAIPAWGFEDTDLIRRLENKKVEISENYLDWEEDKLKRIIFFDIEKYIYHIPHNEDERIKNLINYDPSLATKRWELAVFNKKVFKNFPIWTPKTYIKLEENLNYTRLILNGKPLNDLNYKSLL